MKALISTIEPRETGYRVAQVEPDDKIFPVAEGMYWVDCADTTTADTVWYDAGTGTFNEFPAPAAKSQPTVTGAQTL